MTGRQRLGGHAKESARGGPPTSVGHARWRRWAILMSACLSGVAVGIVPARASVLEGCTLVSSGSRAQSCAFVAHATDEILATGSPDWAVTVSHGGDVSRYGRGDDPSCFLEGSLSTNRRIALCTFAILPGDRVRAWVSGTGVLAIGNDVCDHDPLCME